MLSLLPNGFSCRLASAFLISSQIFFFFFANALEQQRLQSVVRRRDVITPRRDVCKRSWS